MKKAKIIGKKTLSVFLAVLMVLTAWVWVAPQQAEAAAGTYDVQIKWYVDSDGDMNGNGGSISLHTAADNGTGSVTKHSEISFPKEDTKTVNAWNSTEFVWTNVGFPSKFTLSLADTVFGRTFSATVYVYVRKAGTTSWSEAVGSYHIDEWEDNTTHTESFSISNAPVPTSLTWTPSTLSAMICPEGDATATQTVKVVANDQFGVQMYDPTWSVKGSVQNTGMSVTSTTTKSASTTITLTNKANIDTEGVNTQTGTLTAKWGSTSKTKTFTITDSKYDITFSYKIQESDFVPKDTTEKQSVYHGDKLTVPSIPDKYADGDFDYKFIGWQPEVAEKVTEDVDYVADYDEENRKFIQADYTAADEIKAEVQAEKDALGLAKFNAKYTLKTLAALETAISNSLVDYPLGRTKQTTVDGYAVAIEQAYRALEPNRYNVIFIDKNGAIVRYDKDVEFESELTPPDFPKEQKSYYDAEKHYTYDGWDTDEYTSVIDDLVISPVYIAEAHDWDIETVSSTCVQAGTQKYTCKVCGYVKYDGGDQLGDHVWETEFTTDLEPTCTVAGSKSIHCSLCDAQKDITVIPPLGHNFTSQSVAVEATCGRIGIMTKVCDDCLYCEHTIIPALEHDYKETVVAPTCTTKGYTEYVCQRADCGHSYRDNFTNVVAHSYGAWETVSEARCEVAGVKKQTCTECGHVNIGSIDALQHSLSGWTTVVDRTCTGKGYQVKTCSLCNNVIEEQWLDALGHNYVEKTVVNPTCTSKGYTIEECNRTDCGAQRIVNETPALNHAWTSTTHAADCTHSAYIEHVCGNDASHNYVEYVAGSTALTHDFTGTETIISNATCTSDGQKTVKCTRCDAVSEVIIPRLGHSYGAWTVEKEATNNEDGQWKRVCANNADHVEYITIPKGGHNLVEDKGAYKAPKCNEKGQQIYKCDAHDNCPIKVTVELDYAQHTVAQRITSESCTQTGTVEAYCSVCNIVLSTETIPVKAHNFVAQTAVAPTCTTAGYTPYKCSACDFTYNVFDGAEATGHNYKVTTTDATCTATGLKTFTCDCGDSYTEEIPATGHNYVEDTSAATDATCKDPATKTYKCNNADCGDSYTVIDGVQNENHVWGGWQTIENATNTSIGYKTNTCTVCGKVQVETIPATGAHVFDKATGNKQDATCTADGWIEYACSTHDDCGLTSKETVPATGHTQKIEYTAPTCIAEGSSKIVCETCGDEIMSTSIPATGIHDFSGEGVITSPGCTTEGEITYTCETDGCTATKKDKIPAKGHTFTTTVTDAKCGEKGSVVTECKVCNDPTVKTVTELAAKGHIWGATPIDTKAADCENNGSETYKCENCDKTNVVVLPKLGHKWSDWTVVQSTNNTPGSVSRTCSVCNKVEKVDIPAGGHSLVEDTTKYVAPSCTTEGKKVYKCENHDDCGITLEVAVPVTQHTVVQRELEATCKAEGSVEAYCSVCNEVLSTEAIPVKAHVYTEGTAVDATCTTSGYTPYTCSCGHTYNKYDETKPATGHTLIEGTSTATCTTAGEMTLNCEDCTYSTTVAVPALGHSYVEDTSAATDATCTALATKTYKCACGASYVKHEGTLAAHQFNTLVKTVPATNESLGYEERQCVCGLTEITIIEATGTHVFNEKIEDECIAPTCTENGTDVYKCTAHTDCGVKSSVLVPRLGHTGKVEYTAPTCIAEGSSKVVCATCKETLDSVVISATGIHDFSGEGEKVDATCEADGSITYTCETSGCNAKKTEIISAKGHNYVSVVTPAKCEEEGEVVTTCSSCGDSDTVTLAALNHNWNDGVEDPKATCTSEGTMTYTCKACGETKTETVEKLSHDWGDWTVTPSTNTGVGSVSRKCKNCVATETVEIPAGGHNLVETSRDVATCAKEGSVTYTCDTHKGDSACGISVTVTLAKTQHVLEINTEKEASCEENGLVVTKCTECNTTLVETIIPAKGHTITVTTTPATCTTDGSVVEYCEACNTTLNTTTLPAFGHSFTGTESTVKTATCTEDGSKTVQCKNCTETTTVIIPKLGHDWGDWVKVDATNDNDGSWTRTCKNNAEHKETVVIPAGGHNLVEDTDQYVAPTCNTKGKRVYVCNNPAHTNCTVTVTVELDYAQHTVVQRINEASCTKTGSVEAYCSVCGQVFNTKEIPVKAHVYTAGTAVAPTCTTSGYTPYTCSCGDTYNKYDASKPATGHTLVEGASTADCTTAGKMTLTCENCTYTTTVDVPALGHNYVENAAKATEATCAAAATKTYECSRCDVSYTISVGDKTSEHTWGAWEVKESATASSLGYQTSTCTVCGQIKVETIPATGEHNFNTVIDREDATCTEKGWIDYKCSTHTDCGKTSRVELPATGHTEKHEYKNATCTAEGYSRMVCAVCDEVLSTETIPALGHDWNEGNITNATCNTEGEIVRTCSRGCTDTHITKIPVNPNAHQYETKVVPATCTTPGSVVTKCSLCGDIATNETLAQLNHSWNDGDVTSEATCTTEGVKTYTCTICSTKKTEPIAKSGHNWNDWVKTDATNSKDGEWKRVCKTDENHVETLVIPKGGHTFGDIPDSTTPATCTATGTATYNCTAHTGENACGVTITVTLDKLQHEMVTETITEVGCETEGKTVTKCKTCDTQTTETTIPETGHAWGKGVETKAASCTEEGTMTFTCANDATHQYSTKIAKLQHNYVEGAPVAATCTSSGYKPYKCKTCDSSYVILVEAAKCHTYVKDSSTADCENGGVMTLKCACGATMTTDVPALGHDYQLHSKTDANCAAAATETYKCTRCDANYTVSVGSKTENHDWNDWVTVEKADYDSIGYKTRTCKICDKLEVETIPATGSHNLVEDHRDDATCTADGKIYYTCDTHDDCGVTDEIVIPKLGHDEELSYKAASCTEEGYAKIVCSRCGDLESKTLDKLDHSFEIVNIKNSTCSEKGEISLECKNCTETKTVDISVNADAHKLIKNTDLATCTKAGSVTVTCENGCDYNDVTPLPMLQHSWGDWSVKTPSTNDAEGEMIRYCGSGCTETVKIPAGGHAFEKAPVTVTEASCTKEGEVVYKCSAHDNCGVEVTVVLDKAQHTVVTDSETATCENGGYVKVYCSKCNEVYTDITIGKLAHKDKIFETKEATCTTAGYTTFECENCGRGFSRLDAQPTGHKYLNEGAVVTTPATCTEAGYTTYNCDNCDETHTVSIVAAKGHSWTEWTVEKAATNNEKGLLSRTCINGCGEKETAEIPEGGHNFDVDNPANTTTGDCLTKGTKTFRCSAHSDCGIEITVETEFGAHDWSDWTKVDATNDADGYWTRKCDICKEEETLVIPAGNHNLVEDTTKYVEPKCDAKGQRVYKCDAHENCSVTITVVLEMIQHTAGVDKKDATCTENGYVKTYCTACGEVISNVELEKTGHVETTTTRQESTCVTPGWEKVICKCGKLVSEKELPLKAHNYDKNGDGKVDKNDAVFEDGKYTYTCQQAGCGHTITEDADDIYRVRFFDAAGNQIGETQNVKFGESAVAPAAPEKKADGTYHYEFSAWDRNYSEITSDLDIYPTYEKEAHYGGEATCTTLAKCEKCNAYYGEYDESKHIVATKSKAASCETDGWIEYYCTNAGCKYNYNTGVALKKETIGASGHVYGQWTVIQNGTCEIPQIQQRKCVNYGCDKIEERRTQSTHTWLIEPRVEPTCTTVGYSEFRYCVTCNLQIDRVEIPKTDHRDLDGNGYCDYCGTSKGAPKCNCMCHSTGIMKFFYAIVRFFWIITRSSPSCSCGALHY